MDTQILIVDGDPTIRSYLKTALERTPGYQVDVAPDATAALAALRQTGHPLVIADLNLSGQQGGLELLRAVRQERPDTTVVMVTATAAVEEVLQAIRQGAVDVLLKPVSLQQLTDTLQRALSRRQAASQVVDTTLPLLAMRERAVRQLERDYLVRVLTEERGHLGATARRAGVNAKTLYEKMRAYGLRKEDFRRRGSFARSTSPPASSPATSSTR